MITTLFRQYFRAQLPGLLVWLGGTVLMTAAVSQVAPAAATGGLNDFVAKLPPQMQALAGYVPGLSPLDTYIAAKVGQMMPLVFSLYAALLALAAFTREVDRRTIEYLLAQPVRRSDVLLSRFAVLAVNTALLALGVWVSLRLGLAAVGLAGNWSGYALMAINQWLVALFVAAITLMASVRINDYSLGVKLALGAVSACFFVEGALKAIGLTRWERFFSPFSYADTAEILRKGAIAWPDALVLTAVTAMALLLAVPAFERKELTS